MTDSTSLDDTDRIRRWTANQLAEFVDVPRATMLRSFIQRMIAAGVLARPARTRFWFGTSCDVANWFAGRLPEVTPHPEREPVLRLRVGRLAARPILKTSATAPTVSSRRVRRGVP
jgi:hypothetical protein